ncbi:hypothetical protein ACWGI9_19845 [Streptomyces sp. NPDC054833]
MQDRLGRHSIRRLLITGTPTVRRSHRLRLRVEYAAPMLADAINRLRNSEPLDRLLMCA